MPSIIELPEIIAKLKPEEQELFNRFFAVHKAIGKLVLPEEMKPWTEKTFGNTDSVREQTIIKVFNRMTFESALFNELRAKRPIETRSDNDILKDINNGAGDFFCKPVTGTTADCFGRIKGKHCITASNVAKYDALHGLIIFNKHNPLDFKENELQDYFKTSMNWFEKAHKSNKDAVYPFLLWNCLWRAGSSIIHGHFQLLLGEGEHYAEAMQYNQVRKSYQEKFKSNYFYDYYKIHELIGLGFESKKIKIFTSISPRKDKEVTIIADRADKKLFSAIYKVANCLVKDLGVNSFNTGLLLPPMNKDDEWKGFPIIARLVSRGSLSNKTSDIGGMEIYSGSNVIETDPYKVFEKIKNCFL